MQTRHEPAETKLAELLDTLSAYLIGKNDPESAALAHCRLSTWRNRRTRLGLIAKQRRGNPTWGIKADAEHDRRVQASLVRARGLLEIAETYELADHDAEAALLLSVPPHAFTYQRRRLGLPSKRGRGRPAKPTSRPDIVETRPRLRDVVAQFSKTRGFGLRLSHRAPRGAEPRIVEVGPARQAVTSLDTYALSP